MINAQRTTPPSRRRVQHSARRGFTLLEVTLAALIGSLVIIACVALFSAIGSSQKRHEIRVTQTNDFTRAYRVVERSLQLLVMAEAPNANDAEARNRIDRDLQRTDGLLVEGTDEDIDNARFVLRTDQNASLAAGPLVYENRAVQPQILRLALRAAPVAGGFATPTAATDPRDFSDTAIAMQAKQRTRENRRLQRQTNSTSGSGSRAGAQGTGGAGASAAAALSAATAAAKGAAAEAAGTAGDGGASGTTGDGGASAGGDTDEPFIDEDTGIEHPRSPGLRAEFVLLPDGDSLTSSLTRVTATGDQFAGRIADGSGAPGGWSLWYRELPPRSTADDLSDADRDRALSGDTSGLDRDIDLADVGFTVDPSSLRTIRLVSGLRTCQWRVFRKNRHDTQIVALTARELPAYVELSLETLDGRRENWMFEVGWSTGAEPGRPLALGADPINAPQVVGDSSAVGGPANEENGIEDSGSNGSGNGNSNTGAGGGNAGGNTNNPRPVNPPKRSNPRNVRTNTGGNSGEGRINNTNPR